MDGNGRWADNVIIERFWRTIKYCSIFMLGVETVKELKLEVMKFIRYYNEKRLHSALNYQAPACIYQQCRVANDKECYELICDIETYKLKLEKDKLKYAA